MGILETVLRPHLEIITQFYRANESLWLSMFEASKFEQINADQNAKLKRMRLNIAAENFRQQGNQFFKAQNWTQALLMYTQSIAAATEGPLASLAYFNRSAALFQMKLYEDCIKDIDRALAAGYPKHQNLYSLHLRKAKCLKFLNRNCNDCLAKTKKAIKDHSKDADAKRLVELVTSKMEEPEPFFNVKLLKPNEGLELPKLSYGQNPEVPCFSGAIDLVHSKDLGRHIIANRDINTGDVLIVEKSIASSIAVEVHWHFCNFCFKKCNNLIPCKMCGFTMYCSTNCRDSDWKLVHKECRCNEQKTYNASPMNFKLEQYSEPHQMSQEYTSLMLVARLIIILGLDNIKKTILLESKPLESLLGDPRTKGFKDGKFQHATLEALLSLDDNFDKLNNEVLEVACQEVLHLCSMFIIPPDHWLPIGAIFLKLFLLVANNSKTLSCFKADYKVEVSKPKMVLGWGMFLGSSLINHSCDPNMYQVSYGTSAVFRARRPVAKGDQMTVCYMLPAAKYNYDVRQETFIDCWKFKCSCMVCDSSLNMTLDYLPPMPALGKLKQWFMDADLDDPSSSWETSMAFKLVHFCSSKLPATKQMLPKMLALLQSCHASGQKSNRFYFNLQRCIQNYYKTEGNCLFFGAAKEIVSGELDYVMEEIVPNVAE